MTSNEHEIAPVVDFLPNRVVGDAGRERRCEVSCSEWMIGRDKPVDHCASPVPEGQLHIADRLGMTGSDPNPLEWLRLHCELTELAIAGWPHHRRNALEVYQKMNPTSSPGGQSEGRQAEGWIRRAWMQVSTFFDAALIRRSEIPSSSIVNPQIVE